MKRFGLSVLLLSLFSCDCMQRVSGIVIDHETKVPIDNVRVSSMGIGSIRETKTDQNGYFELDKISGGLKCPDVEVLISKQNFITDTIVIENGKDAIVRLKKIKDQY